MGITQLLDTSRQAFRALDAAMNVAGQNIANVESEGYSRRRIDLQAVDYSPRGIVGGNQKGSVGAGVSIAGYDRMRDALLDKVRLDARGGLGYASEQQRVLATVEAMFPSGVGSLQDSLDNFWNGWSDLSDHPTDVGVRLALRGRAESLTSKFQDLSLGLDRIASETEGSLTSRVADANGLLTRISELNVLITHARRGGNPDFGAEDDRGMALQELASLLPARFEDRADGAMSIYVDGMQLVQEAEVMPLTLDSSGPTPILTFGTTGIEFSADSDSGTIGALLTSATTDIQGARDSLDTLVATLVSQVNTVHSAAYGSDGATGRDFFDPAGVVAGSISVSSDVQSDIAAIGAGTSATATGDNTAAMAIHDLRHDQVMVSGTQTMSDYAVDIVSSIGAKVATASLRTEAASASIANLDAMANGVSGVSIDDEMTNLIRLQQAYGAAARVLQTAQDMFDTLLRI